MSPAEIHIAGTELARRTREAQGLPATLRDRGVIRVVVAILVAAKATP